MAISKAQIVITLMLVLAAWNLLGDDDDAAGINAPVEVSLSGSARN